jgi:predicted signal transduction protein with EAL and GGDEF domain
VEFLRGTKLPLQPAVWRVFCFATLMHRGIPGLERQSLLTLKARAICKMFLGSVNGRREVRLFGAERMKGLAETDALTRLANRRSFDEALLQDFEKAKKTGQPLAVLLIDVDRFKAYNDRYGHLAGDEVSIRRTPQVRPPEHSASWVSSSTAAIAAAC